MTMPITKTRRTSRKTLCPLWVSNEHERGKATWTCGLFSSEFFGIVYFLGWHF